MLLDLFNLFARIAIHIIPEVDGEAISALVLILILRRLDCGSIGTGRIGISCFSIQLLDHDFETVHNRRESLHIPLESIQ